MINNADKLNFDVAIGSYSYFSSDKKIIDEKFSFPNIVDSNKIVEILRNPGLWRWTFKRDILEDVFFSENRMGEDQQYLIEIDAFKRQKYFYKKIVYNYMVNQQMQLTNNPIAVLELTKTVSEIKRIINGKYDFVNCYLLVRMNLTSLANEGLIAKLSSLSRLFHVLKASGLATSIKVLRQLFFARRFK